MSFAQSSEGAQQVVCPSDHWTVCWHGSGGNSGRHGAVEAVTAPPRVRGAWVDMHGLTCMGPACRRRTCQRCPTGGTEVCTRQRRGPVLGNRRFLHRDSAMGESTRWGKAAPRAATRRATHSNTCMSGSVAHPAAPHLGHPRPRAHAYQQGGRVRRRGGSLIIRTSVTPSAPACPSLGACEAMVPTTWTTSVILSGRRRDCNRGWR